MTAGWQVVCYAVAFAAFVLAMVVDLARKPYWSVLVALGLASVTLVALWNANALA